MDMAVNNTIITIERKREKPQILSKRYWTADKVISLKSANTKYAYKQMQSAEIFHFSYQTSNKWQEQVQDVISICVYHIPTIVRLE